MTEAYTDNSRNTTVYLEGLDLAGKSSCSNVIQELIGGEWTSRHLTLSAENPVRDLALEYRDREDVSDDTISTLYVAAMKFDIDTHQDDATANVMQDSLMVARSLAYGKVNKIAGTEQLLEIASMMPRFDNAFMLTASLEARQERLAQRFATKPETVTSHDKLVVADPAKFQDIEQCLTEIAVNEFGATIIDTTHMNELAVGQTCVGIMTNNGDIQL